MARHIGAGITGYGISNTLRSLKNERSERINPKDRKDKRVTSGFSVKPGGEGEVTVSYVFGSKHGITNAADRVALVEAQLAKYHADLQDRFKVTLAGAGEQQYLVVTDLPDPAVADTLKTAADRLFKLGDKAASEKLLRWARLAEYGEEW